MLRIKISEIGDWTSEPIKTKFQVTYYANIFKLFILTFIFITNIF